MTFRQLAKHDAEILAPCADIGPDRRRGRNGRSKEEGEQDRSTHCMGLADGIRKRRAPDTHEASVRDATGGGFMQNDGSPLAFDERVKSSHRTASGVGCASRRWVRL